MTLQVYPHPAEARTFYAPDTEPSVDLAVPVLAVVGLSDYEVPYPLYREMPPRGPRPRTAGGPLTPALSPDGGEGGGWTDVGSGPSGSYIGNDFRAAYLPGVTLTGAGQRVGLFELDGYYTNDPVQYAALAGLTDSVALTTLSNVAVGGFSGTPGTNNVEVALDIEMVMSMAPGAQIIVYQGANNASGVLDVLNRMAMDNFAQQLSASWTFSIGPAEVQVFQQMVAQGQSFFNSSGDQGAYGGTVTMPRLKDLPYLTSVGGTTLTTSGAGGAWVSETVWHWGDGVASGGGFSGNWPVPDWQLGIRETGGQASKQFRNIPDVAIVADNVYAVANNGRAHFLGGTSVAAPLWAGFLALVNEKAAAQGQPPVGFASPTLHAIGKSPSYGGAFRDVTTGNNTNSNHYDYFARPGYDLCTGWGSPTPELIDAMLVVSRIPPTWILTGPPAEWSSVASSADGGTLVAVADSRPIGVSWSGGTNWASAGPTKSWTSVTCSADGRRMAATEFGGIIWTSTNSGVNWAESGAPDEDWGAIACSADGTRLVAAARQQGRSIWASVNSGASWTEVLRSPIFENEWLAVASSADGNVLLAAAMTYPSNRIHISRSAGASWVSHAIPWLEFPSAAACSADGSVMMVAASHSIHLSTNLGVSWTRASVPDRYWSSAACSANGRTLLAAHVDDRDEYGDGNVYVSNDGGLTWTGTWALGTVMRSGRFSSVACSADGSQVVAVENDRQYGGISLGFFPVAPSIIMQPASQLVQCGLDADFSVKASGTWPLNYQWYFGSSPLSDAAAILGSTSTNLTLRTVALCQGGTYGVIVTNAHGSVTSAPAILTVELTNPPTFDATLTWSDGAVAGTLGGLAGPTSIEASTNLVNWTAVTNLVLTNSPTRFIDPASTNHPQRFYRAVVQ